MRKSIQEAVLTFLNSRPTSAEVGRTNFHSATAQSGQRIFLVDPEQATSLRLAKKSWEASGEVSQ